MLERRWSNQERDGRSSHLPPSPPKANPKENLLQKLEGQQAHGLETTGSTMGTAQTCELWISTHKLRIVLSSPTRETV